MDTLLLGAGASVEAGLPTTRQLTARVLERFRAAGPSPGLDLLFLVIGGLQFRAGIAGRNPTDETPDIEAVVRAIELLERREQSEAAAFVGSWHSRIAELERRAPAVFMRTREEVLHHLKALLWIGEEHDVSYLEPLCSVLKRQPRLEIATLNFDNVIERFARQRNIDYSAGLDPAQGTGLNPAYRFSFGTKGINEIKLHGSVAWVLHDLPYEPVPFVLAWSSPPAQRVQYAQPGVLFGTASKLVAHGPYLQLLARFQDVLHETANLTVVGYSFRDPHINYQIGAFAERKSTSVRIIDRGELRNAFLENLQKKHGRERIQMVRADAGPGLAEAFGV